jgi:hypothetical protein
VAAKNRNINIDAESVTEPSQQQVTKLMQRWGSRGGRNRSPRKIKAVTKNLQLANAAKARLRAEQMKWIDEPIDDAP